MSKTRRGRRYRYHAKGSGERKQTDWPLQTMAYFYNGERMSESRSMLTREPRQREASERRTTEFFHLPTPNEKNRA